MNCGPLRMLTGERAKYFGFPAMSGRAFVIAAVTDASVSAAA